MNDTIAPPVFERLGTLGDPTRSRLLALLEEREFAVGELRQILQLPQSTVSRHLKVLANDGWVTSRSDGTSHYYRMSPEVDADALSLWTLVRSDMEGRDFRAMDVERAHGVLRGRVDRSREFFSASADRWEEVRTGLYGRRADLLPLFGLVEPGWVVADLGSGTGQLSAALAPFARRVVAVDRSAEMLAAARLRVEGLDNVDLRQGELEHLPLEDGEADLAVASLVLHYVVEPWRALEEMARVLRPGGRLVLVDMKAHGRAEYREEMGHLWPGFDEPDLRQWLGHAGFRDVRLRALSPDLDARGPLLFVATARTAPGPS
ncbi:MAG TPA: metalloregulator ArsR/SmtB family transcription factor [Longimicrobiales bacterium]|jgi:ArsR family transcriptional regulator